MKGNRTTGRSVANKRISIAFVGAGKLAGFLAPALVHAGCRITEIVGRKEAGSRKRARALARRVDAKAATLDTAALDAESVWLAVPDGEIRHVAEVLRRRLERPAPGSVGSKGVTVTAAPRFAFHSSGALGSRELAALRKVGISTASIHPLMTFVAGSKPSLRGVPIAVEGDEAAVRAALSFVHKLGGEAFVLSPGRKVAYHAWATMCSPLLLAYLVTLEQSAREAGLGREGARRMSLPIVQQTVENYRRLGSASSFSGPFVRGDADTVERHLTLLRRNPQTRAVYVALARVALNRLPVRNRKKLTTLLED